MERTFSAFWRALPHEKRKAIRELRQVNPTYNLWPLAQILLWCMTALIMHLIPVLPIRLAGYIFIGLIIHGLAALMHEGVHGNIFRKASLDRWFSFAVGLPALVSATAFRANHMHHHQHNRTEHDPDEMTTVANTPGKLRLILNLWLFFGAFYFILVHIPLNGWRLASRKERRKILLEYGIIVTVFSTIFSLSSLNGSYAGILHYWAFPWVFTAIFTNIRGWTEHVFTVPGNPLTETRTIRSNRLISFLSANVNYHLEHHLFPAIPWYNLPKVHNLLQAEYKEAGAFVHSSYMRYVLRALCTNTNDVVRETGKPCLSRFLSVIFILSLLGSQLNAQHLRESEQHLIFGDSAYTAFDYKLALAAYEKSYTLEPNRQAVLEGLVKASYGYGTDLLAANKKKQAEKYLRKSADYAIELSSLYPDHASTYFALAITRGYVALYERGREKISIGLEVENYCRRSIELDPNYAYSYITFAILKRAIADLSWIERTIARILFGKLPQGSYEDALELLSIAVEIDPQNSRTHFELAITLDQIGQRDKAIAHLKASLALAPKTSEDLRNQKKAELLLDDWL